MPAGPSRRLVIGIGNPDRGDDAIGRTVARRLRGMLPETIEILERDGEAASLLAELDGTTAAVLIDACLADPTAAPGTIYRFDANAGPLPHDTFALSTHGLGLAEAVEFARALGQLPARCIVYAVAAESFEAGGALSPAVASTIGDVVERIRADIFGTAAAEGGARHA